MRSNFSLRNRRARPDRLERCKRARKKMALEIYSSDNTVLDYFYAGLNKTHCNFFALLHKRLRISDYENYPRNVILGFVANLTRRNLIANLLKTPKN